MILKRLIRGILRSILDKGVYIAPLLLSPIEKILAIQIGNEGIRRYPPLFIIGPPRSGTTLLYKVLTEKFKFAFFSNFTAKFYRIPICGTLIEYILRINSSQDGYDFKYGYISGRGEPHECGKFWFRWFPNIFHVYVKPNESAQNILSEIRCEIGGMSYIKKAPMLIKTVYNSMRIAPIVEAIQEANFLVCKRDCIENALSILKWRISRGISLNEWVSVAPREIDRLRKESYAYQVVGQVLYIHKQIQKDIERFGSDRFLEVQYEDFCKDVHGTLNRIKEFLQNRDCLVKENKEVPEKFYVTRPDDIRNNYRAYIEKEYKRLLLNDRLM